MGRMPLTVGRDSAYSLIDSGDTVVTDAYADFSDSDTRGSESIVLTIENTHISNGITVNAYQEYADYAAAERNELTGFPQNISAGNKGLIQKELPTARLITAIKNQTPASAASAQVVGFINKL